MSDATTEPHFDYDIAIVGAGPVGLALAGWLARRSATSRLSIALIDARTPEAAATDPRSLALSHGSRVMLQPLGFPADATPIRRIHVSQRGHFGRTLIEHDEHELPELGYVVRYGSLVAALADAVRKTHVDWVTDTSALPPLQDDESVTVPLQSASGERTIRVRVLVNAEGGLYQQAPRETAVANDRRARDYGQTAIVGTVSVSEPQANVAWERFTNEGPIALLPCGGQRHADYSLVWCGSPDEAARRMQLDDDAFLAELGAAFGARMGRFTRIVGRAAFPLGLTALHALVERRAVAIGNAAQTLHPVAGQGLNLGLRDAQALCDALSTDGPRPLALAHFAQRRALDRRLTIGATDTLARIFTVDFPPLAAMRGLALTALEFLPPVKTALARQMMFGQRR
ncbi:UbiH/UbiF/VisC/COQ6 family ubiquinone biosynthesis hydroxylase [Caballeronia concitans]|uniref:Ubiquinone biosynthesis hydroxylase family protein n=1 Tax=Caballeronia concitans TaxID=1777133 RepID=A0A658QRG7_9BURK|nr:UbiH/UbiF/VisC/COQ6 family ubiquinone biosynthesis hydroxylase [Caballeronia concitans]KIG02197.1 Ubiquinone biosynthesis hydroxylase, UbiH/UbiF/VisC/COQ6 family [Burkholderia sp. MR1]SAL13823.1 ubiquinone biosynthesis hydroxylase family protein [Caballeronia concitans]